MIGDNGVKIVTDALKNKQKQQLHHLSLAENGITNSGCTLICDLINNCPTIQELNIQNNNIDNTGA